MKSNKTMYILLPTVITLLLGLLWAQPNSLNRTIEDSAAFTTQCGIVNSTFNDGEELVYKVYYNLGIFWTAAGLVHFKVTETDDLYEILVTGSTAGFYDNFYRVRDTFVTFLDKETLLPTKFIRVIREGKYRRYNKFVFDQNQKIVTMDKGKDRSEFVTSTGEFTDCIHDIISILYHVRNMKFDNLTPGDTFPVEVYLEKNYALQVKIMDKNVEQKVKGNGKFMTHIFQPQLIAGEVFKEKDQMSIYISVDSNQVPVLIESPLSVGKMKAVLFDHKGLRYNLNAKITNTP